MMMVTPNFSVRPNPELVKHLDKDVEDGVFEDRVSAFNAILASYYHITEIPEIKRAKPGRKSTRVPIRIREASDVLSQ
jgi:hypothetical protein